jgi:hypothetical protein
MEAFLVLHTDEGAGFGGAGNSYQMDITAESVPEPATLGLLALARLAMMARRSRVACQ